MSRPSPYRIVVIATKPVVKPAKRVECPRAIHSESGAKRFAKQYAADAGEAGVIDIELLHGAKYERILAGDVKNSIITRWRPC